MPALSTVARLIPLSIVVLVWLSATLGAQQFSGTVRGTIQDSTGAVVPGAEISVVHIETNDTHTVATDDHGSYVVPQLKPGFYRITVKKAGFRTPTLDQIK